MKKDSVKKIKHDRGAEREAFRDSKRSEYRNGEDRLEELRKNNVVTDASDVELIASDVRRSVLFGENTETQFVDRAAQKWDGEQPAVVTGRYRDLDWIKSDIQYEFIVRQRKATPEIFLELDSLIPYFREAFDDNASTVSMLFSADPTPLVDAEVELESFLKLQLLPEYLISRKRSVDESMDADFPNGLRFLFYFLRHSIEELGSDLSEQYRQSLTEVICEEFRIRYKGKSGEKGESTAFSEGQKHELISKSIATWTSATSVVAKTNALLSQIAGFLGHCTDNEQKKARAFVIIHSALLIWVRRHAMEKEWILQYIYMLLAEASSSASMSIVALTIPDLRVSALETTNFNFETERWRPAHETREECEKRYRVHFEASMDQYFQAWGLQLGLDRTKLKSPGAQGRPVDPDHDCLDWLIHWNKGSTYLEIAKKYNKTEGAVRMGIGSLQGFDMPIRVGKRGAHPKISR